MATETPELKPCPFCGSENLYHAKAHKSHRIECANCGACGPSRPNAHAVEDWNAALRAEVKAEEKESHICAKGRFGSSVMLSDGTKVCLNRGANASVAEVWLSIEKAEQVVMMEEKGAEGR